MISLTFWRMFFISIFGSLPAITILVALLFGTTIVQYTGFLKRPIKTRTKENNVSFEIQILHFPVNCDNFFIKIEISQSYYERYLHSRTLKFYKWYTTAWGILTPLGQFQYWCYYFYIKLRYRTTVLETPN